MTLKACKYKIYPKKDQLEKLSQHFGHNRYVYNWGLRLKQRYYSMFSKNLTRRKLQDRLVQKKKLVKYSWLNESNAPSLLATLIHLNKAYKVFF